MRAFLAVLALTLFPALVQAQGVVPSKFGRPAFAEAGRETMPMMYIDEMALNLSRFDTFLVPGEYWDEMKTCAASVGVDVTNVVHAPTVMVVPVARTIRVHDMTYDSLLYAHDSTFVGEEWVGPTVGYALVRSNVIVVTEAYQRNKYLLRHEALHHILWQSRQRLGHPEEVFTPCDKEYE